MKKIIVSLLLLFPIILFAQTFESHRIAHLQADIMQGDSNAVEKFWKEIKEHGSPLIEAIPKDSQWMLVTFLWQAKPDTKNVIVVGHRLTSSKIEGNEMSRLNNTNVFYISYHIRAKARFFYAYSINDPKEMPDDFKQRREREDRTIPDPLNPHRFVILQDDENPLLHPAIYSVFELPGAPVSLATIVHPEVPHGQITVMRIKSEILKAERRLWIYTPAGYSSNTVQCNLLLLFDGFAFAKLLPTSTILDNLIANNRIPATVAVMIDNPLNLRGNELTCSPPYMNFVATELMPWVKKHYHVTDKAEKTCITGFSYGGLAAAYAGYSHPELFGNVIANSGSFWWRPGVPSPGTANALQRRNVAIEDEWLTRQFVIKEKLPLKFYLATGIYEDSFPYGTLIPTRHLRDVLQAKGYTVTYNEFIGGHELINWSGTLAEGLVELVNKTKKRFR